MLPPSPRAPAFASSTPDADAPPVWDAPQDLVERYLELTNLRRALDDELAYVRAELELLAAPQLSDATPRGRFVGRGGQIVARAQPTCVFDRPSVLRELQRMGRLADVATVPAPSLARFLARDPVVAARLGDMVRPRRGVVLTAAFP